MTTVNPYLTFRGNCEEAFNFYKSVFGGDFLFIGRYKDVPATDRQDFQNVGDGKIMHISLPISKETILMGCDSPASMQTTASGNISLSITTDTKQDADRIFNELSSRGQIQQQMKETFWGSYFGGFTDRYGIQWTINCDSKGG